MRGDPQIAEPSSRERATNPTFTPVKISTL